MTWCSNDVTYCKPVARLRAGALSCNWFEQSGASGGGKSLACCCRAETWRRLDVLWATSVQCRAAIAANCDRRAALQTAHDNCYNCAPTRSLSTSNHRLTQATIWTAEKPMQQYTDEYVNDSVVSCKFRRLQLNSIQDLQAEQSNIDFNHVISMW